MGLGAGQEDKAAQRVAGGIRGEDRASGWRDTKLRSSNQGTSRQWMRGRAAAPQ